MAHNLTASDLKSMPKDKVKEALSSLSLAQLEELKYDWKFWARDKQIPPETGWYIWYLSAGRSFGKTRCGAEYIRDQVKRGVKDIAIIGRTSAETRDVCLYGKSGLLNVCWEGDKTYKGKHLGFPKYYKNDKKLVWANGAVAKLFSAEEPEAPRGSQFEVCWLDELASWAYQQEMWDQIQFCMRIGRPRIVITTTPRSTPLIRSLVDRGLKGKDVLLTTGSSYENTAMPKQFFDELRDKYEGTRLGQQEIHAAILPDNEGALWTASMIDDCQIDRKDLPELQRIVVAVDPAVTNNVESDMTGIVVAGIDINGRGYVLGDYSVKTSPEAWANKAIELYHKFGASRIVYESNQGKDLIPTLFRTIDDNIPLKGVHASQGKIARAEPVSALYEQGKVKHVRNPEDFDANLMELEKQLTSFEPLGKFKSPDRYDACLAKGTIVMTDSGLKPIEDVMVGDKVVTREGEKPVVWSGKTGSFQKTLDIKLSNGYIVKATEEHPFYVHGCGWVQAKDIKAGDNLVSEYGVTYWNYTQLKLSSKERLIEDTQIQRISQNKGTIPLRLERDSELYTETFGSFITDLSQKGTTSTTKTVTTSTTNQVTLSACRQGTMHKNMLKSFVINVLRTWKRFESWLLSGTALRKVSSFMNGLGENLGKGVSLSTDVHAKSVKVHSNPLPETPSCAAKGVSTSTSMINTWLKPTALSADQPSSKINTDLSQPHVLVRVEQVTESKGLSEVYNLHVEGCHEFTACGVLTHNCVWAMTELMLKGVSRPKLTLAYSSSSSLK